MGLAKAVKGQVEGHKRVKAAVKEVRDTPSGTLGISTDDAMAAIQSGIKSKVNS